MERRNVGIDLLKLVLMFMVCVLHTLTQGGALIACEPETATARGLWLICAFSMCAVDCFAMITGFTASGKPQRISKFPELWLRTLFYSVVLNVAAGIFGFGEGFGFTSLVHYAFPLIFNTYWYVTAYLVLMLLQPVLNRYLFELDERAAKKVLIVVFIVFACVNSVRDTFMMNAGCSIWWMAAMYTLGVLMRRTRLLEFSKTGALIALNAVCVLVPWALWQFAESDRLLAYISPLMVLNSMALIRLFSRMKLKGKWIERIAPYALGAYLLHSTICIWYWMKGRFAFLAEMPAPLSALCTLAIAAVIFSAGVVIDFARGKFTERLKLPKLCETIANAAENVLGSISKRI